MPPTYQRVFFLGAGASADLGLPVTGRILPMLLEQLDDGTLFGKGGASARTARERRELRQGLRAVFPMIDTREPPLVTDLFSLLDHALVSQQSLTSKLRTDEMLRLRTLLEKAVLWVLGRASGRTSPAARSSVDRFYARIVDEGRNGGPRTCLVTTNYDRAIEAAVLRASRAIEIDSEVDFGLTYRRHSRDAFVDRPREPAVGIFKLHGSMTWLGCPHCGHVYIRPEMSMYSVGYWEVGSHHNTCHCGYWPLRPVIVAPSLVRSLASPSLAAVWQSALDALRTASEWTFVGYSLPNEDIAIRSLLLRGYHGRNGRCPQVRVVQHGEAKDVEARYSFLFGDCPVESQGFAHFRQTYPDVNAPPKPVARGRGGRVGPRRPPEVDRRRGAR